MPRTERKRSEADIYHVMSRGVNHGIIFEDNHDCSRFLDFTKEELTDAEIELYCWCLMGNHFHFLIHADMETVSHGMRQLLARYAMYFNTRHGRTGHLCQDRFKSEAIDTDEYLLTVVRYIHWNPVKAGLSQDCHYRWSSYDEYLGRDGLCATDWVLEMFGGVDSFKKMHQQEPRQACLDISAIRQHLDDEEAAALAKSLFGENALASIGQMPKHARDDALHQLKIAGATTRQLQRLTGISQSVIVRA